MSVCQRRTGQWLVKFKDPRTGLWRQRQFRGREDAEEFDSAARIALEKDEPLTLREAVLAYLTAKTGCRSRTSLYSWLVNGGRRRGTETPGPAQHLADRTVESLNRQDLESVRQRIRALGVKTSTLNAYVGMLKSVMAWCASEDLIRSNPWQKYRNLPAGRPSHRTGNLEDLARILPHLPPWMVWAVKTALALCLRPGMAELFSLTWASFDWRAGAVGVHMPKTDQDKVVFPPAWYLEEARIRFESAGRDGTLCVCPSGRGRRIESKRTYQRSWDRACSLAGVRMPFYALRHIVASEMLASGADLAAVAAQLGHRDIGTTAQFYTHALARAQRSASQGLGRALSAVVPFGESEGPETGEGGRDRKKVAL